jgi:hypothetical protein
MYARMSIKQYLRYMFLEFCPARGYGMAQFPPSAGRAGVVFKNNASLAAMLVGG